MTTNKNILLIIANGPSCLKNKIGHKIDQFKEIGRILKILLAQKQVYGLMELIKD